MTARSPACTPAPPDVGASISQNQTGQSGPGQPGLHGTGLVPAEEGTETTSTGQPGHDAKTPPDTTK